MTEAAIRPFIRLLATCAILTGTLLFEPSLAGATPIVGQIDTFDSDGDTLGWAVGSNHPSPPSASGGFLTISSIGGRGAGGRLLAFNRAQWAGDYISAGVTSIQLDLENLGSETLEIRLAFEDSSGQTPRQFADWLATTASVVLLSGESGTFTFGITAADLGGTTDFNTLMSNAGAMRILSADSLSPQGDIMVGSLGVDNITAIPEPSTALLVVVGLGGLAVGGRRRR